MLQRGSEGLFSIHASAILQDRHYTIRCQIAETIGITIADGLHPLLPHRHNLRLLQTQI